MKRAPALCGLLSLALAVTCGAALSAAEKPSWGALDAFKVFPADTEEADGAIRNGWPKADSRLRKAVVSSAADLEAARKTDWEALFRPTAPPAADDPKARVFTPARNLTRLLLLDGRMKMKDGNPAGAWADYHAVARLADAVAYQNSLTSFATSLRLKQLLFRPLADFFKSQGVLHQQRQSIVDVLRRNPPSVRALADSIRVEKKVTLNLMKQGLLSFEPGVTIRDPGAVESFNQMAAERAEDVIGSYFDRMAEAVERGSVNDVRAIRDEIDRLNEKLTERFAGYKDPGELVTAFLRFPERYAGEDIAELIVQYHVPLAIPNVEPVLNETLEAAARYEGLLGGMGL